MQPSEPLERRSLPQPWTEENVAFILSLPRSGSTLLQRILATHPEVCTVAESWLLLPLLYAPRRGGVYAEYGHWGAAGAITDFLARLPNGQEHYLEAVKALAVSLYAQVARPGQRLFVEKTPRNALVAPQILQTFARSKRIYLWRNPLAVAASLIETFGKGRWNLHRHRIDLYQGLEALLEAHARERAGACAIRYEDLVREPGPTCSRVFAHLGLAFDPRCLEDLGAVELDGHMGDPKRRELAAVTTDALATWRTVLANPVRKRWARRYLRWIGAERLRTMGYDLAELEGELDGAPTRLRGVVSDVLRATYGLVAGALELDLLARKWKLEGARALRTRHY